MMDIFMGDSMVAAGNNDAATSSFWASVVVPWAYAFCYLAGTDPNIQAKSGFTLPDQAAIVYSVPEFKTERVFYLAGRADMNTTASGGYGGGTNAVNQFSNTLSALSYWIAGNTSNANSIDWTYTSSWTVNSLYGGIGKYTQTNGATASFSFTGDVLAFEQIVCDNNNSSITVKVDGNTIATVPGSGLQTIFRGGSTPIYTPSLRHFSGLGLGSHVATLVANVPVPAGGFDLVMVDWMSKGPRTSTQPLVLLTNPKSTHGDDTTVVAYNGVVSGVQTQMHNEGYNVVLVDAGPLVDTTSMLTPDGFHFNNRGNTYYGELVNRLLPH